jgi:predicted MPP superfamily phosphohydrolase
VYPSIFALFALFTLLATAVALRALSTGHPRPLGLARVAAAAGGVLALIGAFVVAGRTGPVRFTGFGLMQLCWISLALVMPLGGIATMLQRRAGRPVTPAARAVAFMGVLMIPVAVYAMVVEPRRLVLEEASLEARTPLRRELRIGVLSDIQCSTIGGHERRAVTLLMAQEPDLILVAGDLFQGSPSHFERTRDDFVALLQSLSAPGGVWFVRGDVDSDSSTRSHFNDLMEAAGVRVLIDESVRIELDGQVIELYGYDRWGNDKASLLEFLHSPREVGAARLVLAHRPDPVLWLSSDTDLDLFVAGHTHGGQVVIPFYGPPLTLSGVPRAVGAGGLHRVNGAPIYVTRGIGMERGHAPRVRFLCPPEVAVVTLKGAPGAP